MLCSVCTSVHARTHDTVHLFRSYHSLASDSEGKTHEAEPVDGGAQGSQSPFPTDEGSKNRVKKTAQQGTEARENDGRSSNDPRIFSSSPTDPARRISPYMVFPQPVWSSS